MKKQNVTIFCLLFFLIFFLQTNYFSSSAQTQEESLYKRLGGVYNIAAVADDFVDRLFSDPLIMANKNIVTAIGKITKPGLKYQFTEWFCQLAGGPQKYNGRSIKESHQELNITESEWQSMMKDFLATLAKFNIKGSEQNELLVIVGGTKKDIIAPALHIAKPQAPVIPVPPPPPPVNAPQTIPTTPPLPNLMNAPSIQAPEIRIAPSPKNIPSAIPSLPASINTPPPQAPEIRVVPSPTNALPPQVPGFPPLPPPSETPAEVPSFDTIQPKLDIIPEVQPVQNNDQLQGLEEEEPDDSSAKINEGAEAPSDLPLEPALEPAE